MALDSVKEILNCETGGRNEKAVRAERAGSGETSGTGGTSGTGEVRATSGSGEREYVFGDEVMTFFVFSVKKIIPFV